MKLVSLEISVNPSDMLSQEYKNTSQTSAAIEELKPVSNFISESGRVFVIKRKGKE